MKPTRTAISRRTLLGAAGTLPVPARLSAADVAGMLQVNDLDRRIWEEELEQFVPQRIWDMHSHLGLYRFDADPHREQAPRYALNAGQLEKTATIDVVQACNELLYPVRTVKPFVLPNPYPYCDCHNLNEWAAQEVKKVPKAVCAMVVKPELTADYY